MAHALRPPPPGRDPLVRMMVVNWILGAGFGVAFAALLLAGDVGGLGSLMRSTQETGAALVLLFGGFAITFGAAVAATAIMFLPRDDDDRDGGLGARATYPSALVPVRVRAGLKRQSPTRR